MNNYRNTDNNKFTLKVAETFSKFVGRGVDIETGNNMIVYLDREDYKEIGQTIVENSSRYPDI